MSKKYLIDDTYYYFAWSNQTREDLLHAIKYYNIKNVIFFGPEEHEIGSLFCDTTQLDEIKKLLKQKNIKYKIVVSASGNTELNHLWSYRNQKNFLFWEDFFAYEVVKSQLSQNIKPFKHNKFISKHFISLNARAHPWRCLFVDHLYKEGLFDYGYVSWHNSNNWDYVYTFKYWQPKIINFDKKWINNTDGFLDIMIPPQEQFRDSLFSVISESNDSVLKITEKTYLPIYHKRPFIVYGPQYFHRMLKDQGFQLFDEIFDYSFDEIPNDDRVFGENVDHHVSSEERCIAMINETKKILNYDPNDLYKILKPKIEHNYLNLLNIVKKRNINPDIEKIINNLNQKIKHVDYISTLNVSKMPTFLNLTKEKK